MKISIRIFCFGICFSLSHFFISQNFSTGIYTDLGGSEKNLIFYSINGINYVIQKDYDFYYDDIVIRETLTHGLMRNGEEMNYTCGPFASHCKDGYFFEKDGESYYYDELLSAYESNISEDPLDTLNYLYVKVAELPKNWALTPDDRIGELGVINESIIYDISVVKNIGKINTANCPDCIYIECDIAYESETKKFAVVNPLTISDFELDAIRFYPNPTTGIITISLIEKASVSVIDISGKQVMNRNLEMGDATMDMSSLTKGMYLIQVVGESYTKTEKIILN
jgi:hypothetical protein